MRSHNCLNVLYHQCERDILSDIQENKLNKQLNEVPCIKHYYYLNYQSISTNQN